MTAFFAESLRPPGGDEEIGRTDDGQSVRRSMDGLSFDQRLWSWVVSGYVTIPCDVGGTDNAIELTPKFRPEVGANGYVHLLMFSFVALADAIPSQFDPVVTIKVKNDKGPLDTLPAYTGAVAVSAGDILAGVPYLAIYCDVISALGLPARMAIK